MQRSKTLRLIGAAAALSLFAAACSDEGGGTADPEVTDGETTPDDDGTAAGEYDWSDVRRRQAVSMAIDRQAIVDTIFNGARAPGDDFWPATFVGYRGGDWCENLAYNPERAAELWEEAGGNAGPITFWFNSGAGHEDWVEAVSNMLQQNLGIEDVSFESLEFADYLDKLDQAEVDGPFRLGWLMDYPSPGNFLGPIHGTAGSSNHTGFSNEEFDAAVAAGDSKTLEESVSDYQAAGDILCEEVPISPMFFGLQQTVNSENVDNVSLDAFQALNVTDVEDVDGDGNVSVYVCEPQNALFGSMTNETCGSEVVNGLFSGLFSLDKESGELVFDEVAESIESEDDQNWTITLKDGWTFHDGTPVTAQSFVDAWNWASYTPNAAANTYFFTLPGFAGFDDVSSCGTREATQEDVDAEAAEEVGEEITDCEQLPPETDEVAGLTAPDDTTIEIELDAPFPQLPLVLLYNAFDPLPESFYDSTPAEFGEAPIGNGPFMFPEGGAWEHDVQVDLVAYPDFGGEGPNIDSLTYRIYSDDATGYNDVRSGQLDVMDQVPTAELANVEDEFGDRYQEEATSSFNYLGFPIDLELAASWHLG